MKFFLFRFSFVVYLAALVALSIKLYAGQISELRNLFIFTIIPSIVLITIAFVYSPGPLNARRMLYFFAAGLLPIFAVFMLADDFIVLSIFYAFCAGGFIGLLTQSEEGPLEAKKFPSR